MAGGNPTLYGYVVNPGNEIDSLGLSWSDVLRALGIPMPSGLTNPHGHHIVFKGAFLNDIRGPIVSQSQAILERFGIGINDPANLMWASNVSNVHTVENAQAILERLQKAEARLNEGISEGTLTFKQAQAQMKDELQNAGKDVFSRY